MKIDRLKFGWSHYAPDKVVSGTPLFEGEFKLKDIIGIRAPEAVDLERSRARLLVENPSLVLLDGQILAYLSDEKLITRTALWRNPDFSGYSFWAAVMLQGIKFNTYPCLYVGDSGEPREYLMPSNEKISYSGRFAAWFAVLKM
jgi:hypothetical protein